MHESEYIRDVLYFSFMCLHSKPDSQAHECRFYIGSSVEKKNVFISFYCVGSALADDDVNASLMNK